MPPALLLVFWLPGSGKSTVARMVYEALGSERSVLLRTDVIRKELFPVSEYTQEESDRVYAEFYRRTEAYLSAGKIVILDAVFGKRSERDRAIGIARSHGVDFHLVNVFANKLVTQDRLVRRTWDASDADFDTYLFLRRHFEPVTDDHIGIDNSYDLATLDKNVKTNILPLVSSWVFLGLFL